MEKNITPDSIISALMNHAKCAGSDFPVHVFPAKMQRIILELNTTCAFPIDYTALAMLAAISVAIGNTHRVEVKRSWQESAIVYIAIVGRPGDCKSHPLTFVMRPLVNADWKNNQEFQKKHCEYQQAVAMSRKERISAGLDEFPKEPKRLRYLVSVPFTPITHVAYAFGLTSCRHGSRTSHATIQARKNNSGFQHSTEALRCLTERIVRTPSSSNVRSSQW